MAGSNGVVEVDGHGGGGGRSLKEKKGGSVVKEMEVVVGCLCSGKEVRRGTGVVRWMEES